MKEFQTPTKRSEAGKGHQSSKPSESAFASTTIGNEAIGKMIYSTDSSEFQPQNESEHQGRNTYPNHMYRHNICEPGNGPLSPRLVHQALVENRGASSKKVSRDSGCFDDTSLTTLARTSPTASDRSSHSAGIHSHTDESGIHNMNEDCFFEEDERENSLSMYKEKQPLKTQTILSDPKQKSSYTQLHTNVQSPLVKNRSIHTPLSKGPENPLEQHSNLEKDVSKMNIESSGNRFNTYDDTSNKDSKYPSLVERYGRSGGRNPSERISESKFNSVRSIFEQKTKTNMPNVCMSENKKT